MWAEGMPSTGEARSERRNHSPAAISTSANSGAEGHAHLRAEQALLDRVAHQQDAAHRQRQPAEPYGPARAELLLQAGPRRGGRCWQGRRHRLRGLRRRRRSAPASRPGLARRSEAARLVRGRALGLADGGGAGAVSEEGAASAGGASGKASRKAATCVRRAWSSSSTAASRACSAVALRRAPKAAIRAMSARMSAMPLMVPSRAADACYPAARPRYHSTVLEPGDLARTRSSCEHSRIRRRKRGSPSGGDTRTSRPPT